ncbi:hypothetical protein [Spirosoma spitsbergense]|uniref:hypothetical protein n=1 Tax=Spirosoma spitsbergense TaxID=431554 RepID=UPI000378A4CD|nr:hypothetical protein [Spirosoma spitsbergense]
MAGEKKGSAFEALVYLALEKIGYSLDKDLYWGKKPNGVSIDADFVIGTLEAPSHLLMLTSTGQASNYNMKVWRNVGEIFEIKKAFTPPPGVYNLVFEATQKESLQDIMEAISDGNLLVQSEKYGQVLVNLVENNLSLFPASNERKSNLLKELLDNDDLARIAFSTFCIHLNNTINKQNFLLNDLWALAKCYKNKSSSRLAKITFFRRGILKLAILPQEDRNQIYKHKELGLKINSMPDYAITLGFATKSVFGYKIIDKEINNTLDLLTKEVIEYTIKNSPFDRMQRWIKPICNINDVEVQVKFVLDHFQHLKTVKGMYECLTSQYIDPYFKVNKDKVRGDWEIVWIFYFVFDIIKTHKKKKQGFGLSELSKKAQKYLNTNSYPANHTIWRINLPSFVNRVTSAKDLPFEILWATSGVLSELLDEVGYNALSQLGKSLEETVISSNLEQKLMSYRSFHPLKVVVEKKLKESSLPFINIPAHPSLLTEINGQNQNASTTPLIKVGKVAIHWKSAFDQGKTHKVKELIGRVQSLRFEFSGNEFKIRSDIERFVLILDGTFTQSQINTLIRSGWDEIYYLDELDSLIELLKNQS